MNADGTGYTVLKSFTGLSDGGGLYVGVTLSEGVIYGTTYRGGSNNAGTVYKLNADGSDFAVLKHFGVNYGNYGNPHANLTLSGGVLYGTTCGGGGTIFKMNTDGTGFTVLKYFREDPVNYTNAANPFDGMTLMDGVLYGTTSGGGHSGIGTIFRINTNGTNFTVLKHFNYSDGAFPSGDLILSGGVLYGTAYSGGSSGYGAVFKVNTNGNGYTVLKNFEGPDVGDGGNPSAGLTLSGNTLYGTCAEGNNLKRGTVFKVNTDGSGYAAIHTFTGSDGANPYGGVTLSNGALYGTTYSGGNDFHGTVFKIQLAVPILLTAQALGDAIILNWSDSGFGLQAAPTVSGNYTNIPGATSPHTNSIAGPQQFFRLIQN